MRPELDNPVALNVRIPRTLLDRLDAIVAGNDLSRQETIRRMIARAVELKEAETAHGRAKAKR